MSQVTLEANRLIIKTPYDQAFVMALKGLIPYTERKWNPDQKVWEVDLTQGGMIQHLIKQYFGEDLRMPRAMEVQEQETRLLDVRYIGMVKARGSESSALGWVNGAWSVVFSEAVLRAWFGVGSTPVEASSYYAVLGIKSGAGAEDIKSAYRRMAKQWHPDVCREQGAAEQFQVIQRAYEILSDHAKRSRYDAGLALEMSLPSNKDESVGFRSPLRCGYMIAVGMDILDRFVVSKIVEWTDITNAQGKPW